MFNVMDIFKIGSGILNVHQWITDLIEYAK